MSAASEGGGPVLVTGGTGFLGAAVVRSLVARGREVHVLARPSSERGSLAELPVRWHEGDLLEEDSVARAAAAVVARAARTGGRSELVHSAALISYRTADAELSRRVNVEGTHAVLAAARQAGLGRVLFVSSVVAIGHAPGPDAELDEGAAFNGAGLRCAYVTTKRAAEALVLAAAPELDVVVVNPGAIFGPAERTTNTIRFLQRLGDGSLGPLAPPGSLSVVGVEDVAEGLRLALERGERGRRYLLCESNHTVLELFRRAAVLLDARPPRWRIPTPLWRLVALGAELVDRFRPLELATPQTLRLLGCHFRFDAARARRELGWEPRPFDEVLAETVRSARERGLLRTDGGPPGTAESGSR